jgi:hypothetical protein
LSLREAPIDIRPLGTAHAELVYRHGAVATVIFVVIFAALAWVWDGSDGQRSAPVLLPFVSLLLGPHR